MTDQSAPLGVAIVGLGAFGLRYVESFAAEYGVDVRWGCDLDASRHESALAAGAQKVTTDLAKALADPLVQAVVIATPEEYHRDVAIAASDAGKHVIVEKPLATSDDDATAMIDAAARAGTMLLPAFLLRFDRRYATVAQRLKEIGTVRSVYAYRNFDRSLFDQYGRSHSFVENAIHDIDLIRWYVDDVVVNAHGFCRNTVGAPNPDINWGVLEFGGGAIAVLQTSWMYPAQAGENLQWNSGIQLMGDSGVLEVRHDADGLRIHTSEVGQAVIDQTAWATIYGEPRGAFGGMVRHFVATLRGQVPPAGATAQDAREATRIAQRLIHDAGERGLPRAAARP